MEPPPGERDEFDAWYAEEHVPDRMRIPGFLSATRFWAVDGERGPSHLVIYRMQSLEVLSTPEYRRLKEAPSDRTAHMLSSMQAFTRFIGLQI